MLEQAGFPSDGIYHCPHLDHPPPAELVAMLFPAAEPALQELRKQHSADSFAIGFALTHVEGRVVLLEAPPPIPGASP